MKTRLIENPILFPDGLGEDERAEIVDRLLSGMKWREALAEKPEPAIEKLDDAIARNQELLKVYGAKQNAIREFVGSDVERLMAIRSKSRLKGR